MKRVVIAAALSVVAAGVAEGKPKKCEWGTSPAAAEIPGDRLKDIAPGDGGPVSVLFDGKTSSVSLVRTVDGTAVGSAVSLPTKVPTGRVLAFERAAAGYALIVGTPAAKGAAASTPKPVRYLVRHDTKNGFVKEVPADVGEIRALVPIGSTTVIVDATHVRAFDVNMKLIGVASAGTDLGPAARLGGDASTLVAIVDIGEDDKSQIAVFDAAAGTWKEGRTKLPEAPSTMLSFGSGALVVAIVPQKNGSTILQAALVKTDGKLSKWIKWQTVPKGSSMDSSAIAVQRTVGGEVFVQWSRQQASGMGRDDTAHYFGAQVQPDGKLGPLSKATTDGLQPGAAVAASDGLYIAPAVMNKTHPLWRWSCK